MTRRSFVGAIAGAAVALAARPARAASRVRGVTFDARGTTLALDLDHAPFPAAPPAAAGYADRTVFVFVPHHHRCRARRQSVAVCPLPRAQLDRRARDGRARAARAALRQQAERDPRRAAAGGDGRGLVVRQARSAGRASRACSTDALARSARERRRGARRRRRSDRDPHRARCACRPTRAATTRRRAVRAVGGVEVNEVYLFDALYANADVVPRLGDRRQGGRGVRAAQAGVLLHRRAADRGESQRLLAELERAGVRCAHEKHEGTLSREELTRRRGGLRAHAALARRR